MLIIIDGTFVKQNTSIQSKWHRGKTVMQSREGSESMSKKSRNKMESTTFMSAIRKARKQETDQEASIEGRLTSLRKLSDSELSYREQPIETPEFGEIELPSEYSVLKKNILERLVGLEQR